MTIPLTEQRVERTTGIPDGHPEVGIQRLHLDRATGATTSIVEFPPGWERLAAGHYSVDEEFVVLRGSLELSGIALSGGDYVWVPAGTVRSATTSPGGALTLAWFAGPPQWRRTELGPGPEAIAHLRLSTASVPPGGSPLRGGAATGGPGSCTIHDAPVTLTGPAEALFLEDWQWVFVEAGASYAADSGRVLVRRHG